MSTKTLLKRLALGTVVALGASVLTTTAANATAATGVATIHSSSIGVLGSSTSTALASSATLLSTGSLVLASDGDGGYYKVSAGAYISGSDSTTAIAKDQASVDFAASTGNNKFTVTPTGAAGTTFVVTGYASSTSAVAQVLTVTIAGTSVAGAASASTSHVNWVNAAGGTADTDTDLSGASAAQASGAIYLQINAKDAYKNAITKAGALTVTATDGAVVSVDTSAAPAKGTYTTAVSSAAQASGRFYASVYEKTTGTGWAGTVTVSYNGVVLGTKSGTIAGYAKKIVISNNKVAKKGATTVDAVRYHVYDAAGNEVDGASLTASSLTKNTIGTASVLSSISVDGSNMPSVSAGTAGKIDVNAGSGGSSTLVVQYVNPDGSVVLSNSLVVNVGDAADTYKVALDKSSYNQGDLATLTITFLDAKGNLAYTGTPTDSSAYDSVTVSNGATTPASDAVISAPMMTLVGGSLPLTSSPDKNGQMVLTYTVGSTGTFSAGDYQLSASFPTVNAADGSAQTVKYSVANPSAGTSLNDVLKGIVSLIASINKQIAALAKLITPKKK